MGEDIYRERRGTETRRCKGAVGGGTKGDGNTGMEKGQRVLEGDRSTCSSSRLVDGLVTYAMQSG